MSGSITRGHAVAILEKDVSVCCDEHRAERLVARLQSLRRKFDAAAQVLHFRILHHDWFLGFYYRH
jgi:hypothetical protein